MTRRYTPAVAAAGLAIAGLAALAPAAQAAPSPGPFVTFLFSRTEQTPAQNCVPDPGAVSLSGDVAPWMASQGLAGTGTVNTLATSSAEGCTHGGESITSSWADLAGLAQLGWKFTPHEYDSAARLSSATPQQRWNVTCGQAQALAAQGLGPGTGMISYPGLQQNSPAVQDLQATDGAACFDWGRHYDPSGLTGTVAASTAPYWQNTLALKGGPGKGSPAYTDPATVISKIQALQPGQWLTIQVYLLVSGTNPAGDAITWSCGQPGVPDTSSDAERYCYSDAQAVMQAAAMMQQNGQLTVTDPATVAAAWGRSVSGMPRP